MTEYEILVLPQPWIQKSPCAAGILAEIINKGYDKARYKYGLVTARRIEDGPQPDFMNLTSDGVLLLLLGSKEKFEKLRKGGYKRLFVPSRDVDDCLDFDIPSGLVEEFGPLNGETVKVERESFSKDHANRVLATIAFKPHKNGVELTGYTSFLKGIAPAFLDFAIVNVLLPMSPSCEAVYASIIEEHSLVPYYEKFCQFQQTGERNFFEHGTLPIPTNGDYHMVVLRRSIKVS